MAEGFEGEKDEIIRQNEERNDKMKKYVQSVRDNRLQYT